MPDLTFRQTDIQRHIDRVIAIANMEDAAEIASTGLSPVEYRNLREWLDAMSQGAPCSLDVLKGIGRAVGTLNTNGEAFVHIDDEETLSVVAGFSPTFDSQFQQCAFWLACFLHDASTDHIGRCAISGCDRFLVRARVGRPKEYCSPKHASLARVWKKRGTPNRSLKK